MAPSAPASAVAALNVTIGTVAAWMPLAALLASMPVFAVRARGRPLDPDVARRPASVLLGYWLRDWMIWVLSPIERLLVQRRVSPDTLNYLGAALGLAAGAAFIARELPLAAWLIALGGVCDILDGRIARARGLVSPYGAFLDSTLDRFGETFTFVGVAWYLSGSAWMSAAAVLAIGGSLLVSYTRARGEALGVTGVGGVAQRPERLVLLAVATLLDGGLTRLLGWPSGSLVAGAVVAVAVSSLLTALYRLAVIARTLAALPSHEEASRRESGAAARR